MNEEKGFDQQEYEFYRIPKSTRIATVSGTESFQKPISIDKELARVKSVPSRKKCVPATRKKKMLDNKQYTMLLKVVSVALTGGIAIGIVSGNYFHDLKDRSDTFDSMIATVQSELSGALNSKEERFLAYDTIASSFGLDLTDNQDSDYIIYMTDQAFSDENTDYVVMNDLAGCDTYDELCLQHGYTTVASDSGIRYPDKAVYYNYMQAETDRVIDHLRSEQEVVRK